MSRNKPMPFHEAVKFTALAIGIKMVLQDRKSDFYIADYWRRTTPKHINCRSTIETEKKIETLFDNINGGKQTGEKI